MSSQPSDFELVVFGLTDVGRVRSDNQDSFAAVGVSADGSGKRMRVGPMPDRGPDIEHRPNAESRLSLRPAIGLLLVADGMGGVQGGATASRLAVSTFVDEMERRERDEPLSGEALSSSLREAAEEANTRIRAEAATEDGLRGMGTTLTAVGILGNEMVCAQVGDSRCYLYRAGGLRQLTRDQTVVQEMVDAGTMSPADARVSDQRNLILQALGSATELDVVLDAETLSDGDVLLLCSDGLTGVLEDDRLVDVIESSSDLGEACERLVRQANEGGGPDNITVLLARLDRTGQPPDD